MKRPASTWRSRHRLHAQPPAFMGRHHDQVGLLGPRRRDDLARGPAPPQQPPCPEAVASAAKIDRRPGLPGQAAPSGETTCSSKMSSPSQRRASQAARCATAKRRKEHRPLTGSRIWLNRRCPWPGYDGLIPQSCRGNRKDLSQQASSRPSAGSNVANCGAYAMALFNVCTSVPDTLRAYAGCVRPRDQQNQMCSAAPSAASTASCIISDSVGCGKMVCASSWSVSSPVLAMT